MSFDNVKRLLVVVEFEVGIDAVNVPLVTAAVGLPDIGSCDGWLVTSGGPTVIQGGKGSAAVVGNILYVTVSGVALFRTGGSSSARPSSGTRCGDLWL